MRAQGIVCILYIVYCICARRDNMSIVAKHFQPRWNQFPLFKESFRKVSSSVFKT